MTHALVPAPGTAWVGEATIDKQPPTQVRATRIVVWDTDQHEPRMLPQLPAVVRIPTRPRRYRLFARGQPILRRLLHTGHLWANRWLT